MRPLGQCSRKGDRLSSVRRRQPFGRLSPSPSAWHRCDGCAARPGGFFMKLIFFILISLLVIGAGLTVLRMINNKRPPRK
jgi:hypothetical protein